VEVKVFPLNNSLKKILLEAPFISKSPSLINVLDVANSTGRKEIKGDKRFEIKIMERSVSK